MPNIDLTDEQAEAVRCALLAYANTMRQFHQANSYKHPDYRDQARLCDLVLAQLEECNAQD